MQDKNENPKLIRAANNAPTPTRHTIWTKHQVGIYARIATCIGSDKQRR